LSDPILESRGCILFAACSNRLMNANDGIGSKLLSLDAL
jgi:hypothetical protein